MAIRGWILAGIALISACEGNLAPDMRRGLDRGRDAAERWITESARGAALSAPTAIALGYLERLRLGFGSPFRLAEQALADPRLESETREAVAWAVLARTLDRDAYRIDGAALDGIARAGAGTPHESGVGALHLALIDRAVRTSKDARAAEAAVRLAYAEAAAAGMLDPAASQLVARAAALLRDREIARGDVRRLLEAASRTEADPLALLREWRAERRFEVEAPALAVPAPRPEPEALAAAQRLARALEELETRAVKEDEPARRIGSLLGGAAAHRLADLADSADAPPQAAVAMAVARARGGLLEKPGLDEKTAVNRARFVERAFSEERFVAEYALLLRDAPADGALAATALSAAVALRAYAQEPVWFPGFPAPSADDLVERYGLGEVRFGAGIPPAWEPYFRRAIDLALADLRGVLPALDFAGLRFLVTRDPLPTGTLALHDPRGHRVILPALSGAGTIAHEIAHDLDWQIALRRYGVRGNYASDGAARAPGDPLAFRLNELAASSADAAWNDSAGRPAEILARSIDWFVATSLAAQGRSNGYLTSIQDDVLTGHGSGRPPVSRAAAEALLGILDEVAPVQPEARDWFVRRYGQAAPVPEEVGATPEG